MDSAPHRSVTILVADDHGPARRLVALTLAPIATVIEARSGREAQQLCHALEPALAILDLSMPGELSGIDTCRALRADPHTAALPVLIFTASSRSEHASACLEAGANAFLQKPFSSAALTALVRGLVPALSSRPPLTVPT